MKIVEDFKRQAKEKNITRWNIHDCYMCGYQCGYIIRGDKVFYDSGCDCTGGSPLQIRSWEDLTGFYNMQNSKKYINEMDKFWGFDKLIKNK